MATNSSKYRIQNPQLFLSGAIFLCLILSSPANSTVLEWDESGDARFGSGVNSTDAGTVSDAGLASKLRPAKETLAPRSRSKNLSARQVRVRALVQEIALKHASNPGVRKAGISALQFVDLFDALIHRESKFDPKAVSAKGAKGLGQLMPAMMLDHGVTDPFNPTENLTASAAYLTYLLGEFKSPELALAAYNAGPTRVRKLGRIPNIAETENYIKWIFKTAQLGKPELSRQTDTTANTDAKSSQNSNQTWSNHARSNQGQSNQARPVSSSQTEPETPFKRRSIGMGILKHKTSIAFIMGLALIASISPALAQDLSPITTMLTTIGTTLTGPLGHAAGLIAVCAIGLAFMTGRMNWPLATSIVLGLVILFGAAEILAGIA